MAKRALIFAPHTDDAEIGCGATIARLAEEDWQVLVFAFSPCISAIPKQFSREATVSEMGVAMATLGVTGWHIGKFQERSFPRIRHAILFQIRARLKMWNPAVIFVPSPNSIHQDHETVGQEAVRAVNTDSISILTYQSGLQASNGNGELYFHVSGKHLKKKIGALHAYHSQHGKPNFPNSHDVIARAIVAGKETKTKYAEKFGVIRWVMR